MLEYIRLACAVPRIALADVQTNTKRICDMLVEADEKGCDVVTFPELALTGYSCGDLFLQQSLHEGVRRGLRQLLACSAAHPALTAVIGLPLVLNGLLYNCAAVIGGGELRGLVTKTYLPNYDGAGEKRWFASGDDLTNDMIQAHSIGIDAWYSIPVGSRTVFEIGDGAVLGVELCEDIWAPIPPSSVLALGGAEVIVNLSASPALPGRKQIRMDKVRMQSAGAKCVYAYCSSGLGESTQDTVCSGYSVIAQNGVVLSQSEECVGGDYLLVQDADLGVIRSARVRNTTFRDSVSRYSRLMPIAVCPVQEPKALRADGATYRVSKLPFVPEERESRRSWCREVFAIQAEGLRHRLETVGAKAVIGISGGLDSTLALLVAVEAVRRMGKPMTWVHGITMPCFGTSDRTYRNAWELMEQLGISSKEVNIRDAVNTHFRDIGHDPAVHDATYENSQARERTQILMDYAGEVGGLVVGTGDLSELALGWCTYNGDHMSMYSVNGAVPKTLIRWVVEAVMELPEYACVKEVLADVLDTPISPELLPPDETGKISQQTEDIVGPYALHDFFLYYVLGYGYGPRKIYDLACRAFRDDFDAETVKKWLRTFFHRFFTQQFKRNCQPDGVKAGILGLGPRCDWHMPSDASARLWLEEAERL